MTGATAPTPASIDASAALAQMKAAVADWQSPLLRPATLDGKLGARFGAAEKHLVDFAFNHSDQGNGDSGTSYVLSAPGASTFVGYAVWAFSGDDREGFKTSSAAYYTTAGELITVETASSGVSDSEDAGSWAGVDLDLVGKETKALEAAVSFVTKDYPHVTVTGKTAAVKPESLPFAALVSSAIKEVSDNAQEHSDLGNDASDFVSLSDENGKIVGYIFTAEGGDDADFWHGAGYALFSAQGQLVGRQIATSGRADNMSNDDVR